MPAPAPARAVAVIGAGMAGLACARALRAAGRPVRLFDKGRAPGGRVATRRTDEGDTFDHGAAFFTSRDPGFEAALAPLREAGLVVPWRPASPTTEHEARWVAVPGMSALPRALAADLEVVASTRITQLVHAAAGWTLVDEGGERHGPFEACVVALPAPQVVPLLASLAPEVAAWAGRARYAPCWAVMATWPSPLPIPYDLFDAADPILGWAAREPARPGRAAGERWVLHGTAEWSQAQVEANPDVIITRLLDALRTLAGTPLPPPTSVKAHRWRYARVTKPLGVDCLVAPDGLVACGDWCLGARVEAAWLSGVAAAGHLVRSLV